MIEGVANRLAGVAGGLGVPRAGPCCTAAVRCRCTQPVRGFVRPGRRRHSGHGSRRGTVTPDMDDPAGGHRELPSTRRTTPEALAERLTGATDHAAALRPVSRIFAAAPLLTWSPLSRHGETGSARHPSMSMWAPRPPSAPPHWRPASPACDCGPIPICGVPRIGCTCGTPGPAPRRPRAGQIHAVRGTRRASRARVITERHRASRRRNRSRCTAVPLGLRRLPRGPRVHACHASSFEGRHRGASAAEFQAGKAHHHDRST